MPGAYTRSKLMAEKRALEAAASGLPVVIANPTMPIGTTGRNLTPRSVQAIFASNGNGILILDTQTTRFQTRP
jgi:dihydroflavonol-4-reductase